MHSGPHSCSSVPQMLLTSLKVTVNREERWRGDEGGGLMGGPNGGARQPFGFAVSGVSIPPGQELP